MATGFSHSFAYYLNLLMNWMSWIEWIEELNLLQLQLPQLHDLGYV